MHLMINGRFLGPFGQMLTSTHTNTRPAMHQDYLDLQSLGDIVVSLVVGVDVLFLGCAKDVPPFFPNRRKPEEHDLSHSS
jgi:hypothetical protein